MAPAQEGSKSAPTGVAPTVDEVLSKYEASLGGPGAAQRVTSVVVKGTVADIAGKSLPVDITAKGSETHTVVTHEHEGDAIVTVNGNSGWRTTTEQQAPRDLRPAELEAARLEDPFYVTGRIKQVFSDLRIAQKPELIDRREAYVVSGRSAGSTAIRLYFDKESGALSRLVYNTETLFGPYYTQVDYADFRDAGGLKLPYRWTISRVRAEVADFQVADLKVNVAVGESKFAKPSVPPAAPR
jgi:hypothetical protein